MNIIKTYTVTLTVAHEDCNSIELREALKTVARLVETQSSTTPESPEMLATALGSNVLESHIAPSHTPKQYRD